MKNSKIIKIIRETWSKRINRERDYENIKTFLENTYKTSNFVEGVSPT